jgi:hypothetical protein
VETGPRIPKEVRGLLHELAAAWADVADCRALEVVQLKGAMTNEVYQVRWAQRCGRRRIKYPRRGSGDGGRHNAKSLESTRGRPLGEPGTIVISCE